MIISYVFLDFSRECYGRCEASYEHDMDIMREYMIFRAMRTLERIATLEQLLSPHDAGRPPFSGMAGGDGVYFPLPPDEPLHEVHIYMTLYL